MAQWHITYEMVDGLLATAIDPSATIGTRKASLEALILLGAPHPIQQSLGALNISLPGWLRATKEMIFDLAEKSKELAQQALEYASRAVTAIIDRGKRLYEWEVQVAAKIWNGLSAATSWLKQKAKKVYHEVGKAIEKHLPSMAKALERVAREGGRILGSFVKGAISGIGLPGLLVIGAIAYLLIGGKNGKA